MAEEQGTETGTVEEQTTSEQPAEKDWQAEAEKWKSLARKHEGTAKQNADKAKQYDTLAEASKSEQEKAVEAAKAEGIAAGQSQALRFEVALDKGLPKALAVRLQGSTKAELEADADELLKLAPAAAGQQPPADLGQGRRAPIATSGFAAGKAEAARRFGAAAK